MGFYEGFYQWLGLCGIVQPAGIKRQLSVFDEGYSVGGDEVGAVRVFGGDCEKILLGWSGDFLFQVNHLPSYLDEIISDLGLPILGALPGTM